MEEKDFGNETKKTVSFYIAIAVMLILFVLMMNTDLLQYSQHEDTGIPSWFFKVLFPVDFVIFASMVLIYFYRKIGVFLLPSFALIHHVLYEFYLSTTLLSGLHLLFAFVGVGLLVIIPRWNVYK